MIVVCVYVDVCVVWMLSGCFGREAGNETETNNGEI